MAFTDKRKLTSTPRGAVWRKCDELGTEHIGRKAHEHESNKDATNGAKGIATKGAIGGY